MTAQSARPLARRYSRPRSISAAFAQPALPLVPQSSSAAAYRPPPGRAAADCPFRKSATARASIWQRLPWCSTSNASTSSRSRPVTWPQPGNSMPTCSVCRRASLTPTSSRRPMSRSLSGSPRLKAYRSRPTRRELPFRVPDVEVARERLRGRGVEFLGETLDTGVCLMGFFYDPDGNVLILHRRYAPR
jgi:hypothetical protein